MGRSARVKSGAAVAIEAMHHLLAGAIRDMLGPGMEEIEPLAQQRPGLAQAGGRLGLEDELHLVGELADGLDAERQGHAALRAHGIDGHWNGGGAAIDGRLLEKQGLAAARRFHLAVRDFRDLQFRGDGHIDPLQLAGFIERGDELGKRTIGHEERELSTPPGGGARFLPSSTSAGRKSVPSASHS